jgi:hypothetical protein
MDVIPVRNRPLRQLVNSAAVCGSDLWAKLDTAQNEVRLMTEMNRQSIEWAQRILDPAQTAIFAAAIGKMGLSGSEIELWEVLKHNVPGADLSWVRGLPLTVPVGTTVARWFADQRGAGELSDALNSYRTVIAFRPMVIAPWKADAWLICSDPSPSAVVRMATCGSERLVASQILYLELLVKIARSRHRSALELQTVTQRQDFIVSWRLQYATD